MTGYSNVEEAMAGVREIMPFGLEDALAEASSERYEKGEKPYDMNVVVGRGGKLINGQNPLSAGPTVEAIVKEIMKQSV